ncbi:RDD family protein [Neobacillus sp. LXY-1]|uniref:RDD family protein n=1 Tax=Neobacillus sp. LXY-1 TaxID=3379133 RepID=UPI003EDFF349
MNQEQMEIKTPEYVSIQFQLAGLGSRAAAFIIDQLILTATNVLIILTTFLVMKATSDFSFFFEDNVFPIAIMVIVLFIINWGYFFVFEFFSGGKTIGKRALGIRVIQENGHSITLLSSFIRNLLRIIDSLPAGYLLGIMMIFLHRKHKRLGDLVAGTIVIHERKAKSKKKQTSIEKEIQNRELSKDKLILDDWTYRSYTAKDWKLLHTYANRFTQLPLDEKKQLTQQISKLLLPKMGLEVSEKTEEELENALLVLYLHLREEWEFEL